MIRNSAGTTSTKHIKVLPHVQSGKSKGLTAKPPTLSYRSQGERLENKYEKCVHTNEIILVFFQ